MNHVFKPALNPNYGIVRSYCSKCGLLVKIMTFGGMQVVFYLVKDVFINDRQKCCEALK